YNFVANVFSGNTDLTFYIDLDNHLGYIANSSFLNATNFKILKADASSCNNATQCIRASGLIAFSNATTLINNNFTLGYPTSVKYMRLPVATSGNSISGLRNA